MSAEFKLSAEEASKPVAAALAATSMTSDVVAVGRAERTLRWRPRAVVCYDYMGAIVSGVI